MYKVVIASKNPVKEQAARLGFHKMLPSESFTFLTISVSSGVDEQPCNDHDTFVGASNRAKNAALRLPEADFWVGIEGGIEKINNAMMAFAWVIIEAREGRGMARSGAFLLPRKVAELIDEGKELGEVDDLVFGIQDTKFSLGAVGILTRGKITRASYYAHAVALALIPLINKEFCWY